MHARAIPTALGVLLLSLALSAAAHAAPFVDDTCELSESTAISTVPLLGVTNEIPPQGTIEGTRALRYASDGARNIVTGPVELMSARDPRR